ncbi:MAG: 30S ribosomal protein S2, partial [Patescibacteria group bacterium]|nr:30S ribosomal protein S2 [Patescibacteria group bacterium]
MNNLPSLEELLLVGAQFGHKPERTNPKAKKYVFGIRDGVNVINLEKTREKLAEALAYVKKASSEGKVIVFVSSKRQAKDVIKKAAEEATSPYIDMRWLGGMLTNFETIKKSIRKLESLEAEMASENFKLLTKKEKLLIERKKDKLLNSLRGIRSLSKTPDILFIVDTAKENTAVLEAMQMHVPIVG